MKEDRRKLSDRLEHLSKRVFKMNGVVQEIAGYLSGSEILSEMALEKKELAFTLMPRKFRFMQTPVP